MAKVHTRMKRKLCISSNTNYKINFNKSVHKTRPKTFKSEEAAQAWAKAQGIEKYELVNLRLSDSAKKIKVVY
ncbi:hypothetical protein HN385_01805 [archaeon]|jgi:hypothetical protein|nr:hypothetical protein [archaeon]MBT3451564.1 hypothetical protein [archaeon]MBT6869423.1 hypothetical protein [archaeon]MBT7192586.1 hypothetical protein [archaeon]MBT7380662.1 hypothetical protein [archaeon]